MTFRAQVACVAAVCALSTVLVVAQGKGKAPAKWPGTASFRCVLNGCPEGGGPDGILGDGSDYAYVQNVQNADQMVGAGMYSANGDMHINLGSPSQYHVWLDFRTPVDNAGCSVVHPAECFPYGNQLLKIDTKTEIQTRLTDAAGNDTGGGLLSMAPGADGFARVRFDFTGQAEGDGLLWRVRFNKLDYAGSSDMAVVRLADKPCTWVFTADTDDLAGVWTSKTISRKKAERIDYGLYVMPFQLTFNLFDITGCPTRTP